MHPLAVRFPRLANLPRLPLVSAVTPVERAPTLSRFAAAEVWVKREDLSNALYGGNKTRKLGFLLGDARARGADTLLTTGALGSHHALATAIHGKEHGFDVHAFLSPQPWTEHVDENLRAHVAVGTELHGVRSALLAPPAMALKTRALRRAGRAPYGIPHGGSSAVGTFGYVEAGLELARQIEEGAVPEPEAVYVALGSGASAVGLAIGLAAYGMPLPVHAILVTTRLVGNRAVLGHLASATIAALREVDPRFPDVRDGAMRSLVVDDAWMAVGYGVVNDEVSRVIQLGAEDGLTLDPTYTAPALATLLEDAQSARMKRVVFLHTVSSADLGHLLRRSPIAPAFARKLAGRAA